MCVCLCASACVQKAKSFNVNIVPTINTFSVSIGDARKKNEQKYL